MGVLRLLILFTQLADFEYLYNNCFSHFQNRTHLAGSCSRYATRTENRLLNKTPEGLPPHPRVENHDLEMQTGTLKEPALRRRFDTRDRKHDARARVLGCGGCGLGLLSGTGAFLLSLYLHVDFVPTWRRRSPPGV
jgi:hypothetical protein